MIVPTRLRGLSDAYGSWKTICSSRRSGRRRRAPRRWIGCPWKMISPAVGSSRRTIVRPSVDFPHREAHVVDGVHPRHLALQHALANREVLLDVPDLEQRMLARRGRLLENGHAASTPLPKIVSSRRSRL